ncbi:hypothetical protein BCR44DRAFT_54997 [Catenaria anguillulae PL171]|uniref:JmjC domain-containing protein n=1 Tax=Catenaria anguillulae PL171 TaxID=765915 RepID=A0A1Y2HP07_9FUNG|nr:hypothetical protein BCR44DRAFT_54997 [Catenaria anguillulae PL171]
MKYQSPLAAPRPPPTIDAKDLTPELFAQYRNRRPLLIRNLISVSQLATWTGPDLNASPLQSGLARDLLLPSAAAATNDNDTHSVMLAHDGRAFVDDERFTQRKQVSTEAILAHVTRPAPPLASPTDPLSKDAALGPADRMYYRAVIPPNSDLMHSLPLNTIRSACLTCPDQDRINPDLVKAWVSSPGCVTPLHFDYCQGLLLQIIGTKFFMQFAKAETMDMYPSNSPNLPRHVSRVPHVSVLFGIDPRTGERATGGLAADLREVVDWTVSKFPRIKETEPYGVVLGPGDALYTPPGWMHEVVSVSGSVSVTVPWDMTAEEFSEIPPYMMRD